MEICIFSILIFVEHCHKHLVSGCGVGSCRVSVFQFFIYEETICSFESTRLHLHEDIHHIDEVSGFYIKVDACTDKLFHKKRHVEFQNVITSDITRAEEFRYLRSKFFERLTILYISVRDMMNRCCFRRNRTARIYQPCLLFLFSVSIDFQHAYFNNTIMRDIQSSSLKIEKRYRFSKI